MQSNSLYSCALPKFFARANQYSSCGCRSAGQACAQRVQRMHGMASGGGGNSAGDLTMMQLVALTTGTSPPARSMPIIGPPMT